MISSSRARTIGIALAALVLALTAASVRPNTGRGQIETVESSRDNFTWVSRGRIEGHLALNYSSAGAFSPDSSTLAVVGGEKIVLMSLRGDGGIRKILRPHLQDIGDLQIQSANFIDPTHLLLFGTGLVHLKGERSGGSTPLLAFQWDTEHDALAGKVSGVGQGGGFGPPRYFPEIRHLGLYKDGNFDLWSAATGKGARFNIPSLTRQPMVYEFSFDGHWLLLAQMAASATADPVVVRLSDHQFVDTLRGHHGTVLGLAFSRDSQKAATACEDGKVRIFSVPDWKLLLTLAGHVGPVHSVGFSVDGAWVVTAGEDKTVRVWSASDGKPAQTLEEPQAAVLSAAFSPNGEFIAASTEAAVVFWERK